MLALLGFISAFTYAGHGVLVSGERPIAAYMQTQLSPHGVTHLDIWEVADGQTLRTYDANMTKLLHTIVVSDDLRAFAHIHPVLHPNGHFTIDIRPTKGERYHVFIDGDPHGLGRQVFRFDVPGGSSHRVRARTPNPSRAIAHAGPYEIRLDSTTVPPGSIATLQVTIRKNGAPATDLHPYLGAMAHGVFVGLDDLSYMHGHGMDEQMLATATANDCGDAMMAATPPLAPNAVVQDHFAMQVLAPRAQRYDFWLQFTGGRTLYTVPFLITAR
ncbi:MAG: hypothetical protein M3R30_09435 [Candidatus Eremiobacteraeota bacterium]|nr:hypothetical protein [Candidatus Eremiobacteraeota bacterium]